MSTRYKRQIIHIIRFCKIGIIAGLLGMTAGMGGYIYIQEFSNKTPALLQAAKIFSEIDTVSFILALTCAILISFLYLYLELQPFFTKHITRKTTHN